MAASGAYNQGNTKWSIKVKQKSGGVLFLTRHRWPFVLEPFAFIADAVPAIEHQLDSILQYLLIVCDTTADLI